MIHLDTVLYLLHALKFSLLFTVRIFKCKPFFLKYATEKKGPKADKAEQESDRFIKHE